MESFIYIVRFVGNDNIPSVPLVKIVSVPKPCAVRRNSERLFLLFLCDTASLA